MQQLLEVFEDGWQGVKKTDPQCVWLADRHYSRISHGADQFTRPGENLVYRTSDGLAVWVTWRSKFERNDAFGYAWECTIFRNESDRRSSRLIKNAVLATVNDWGQLPADGLITYVSPTHVKSKNPGYSFERSGFKRLKSRSIKGLIPYQITQERLDMIVQEERLSTLLLHSLDSLKQALEIGDAGWPDCLYETEDYLQQYLSHVLLMKKKKNKGYEDTYFELQSFFELYGELTPQLEQVYWSFKWENHNNDEGEINQ